MKMAVTLVIVLLLAYVLAMTVEEMPTFGSDAVPSYNNAAKKYTRDVINDTGTINAVTAIVVDYRAFDTLGEASVLFAASIAVMTVLKKAGGD